MTSATLADCLLIPVGRCKPGIEVTAEHVAQMGRDERLPITTMSDRPEALGYFTPEARPGGLWATRIELTVNGAFLATSRGLWLAACFSLDARDESGAAGARCYEAVVKAGAPPWSPA